MMGKPDHQDAFDFNWRERIPKDSFWAELYRWQREYLDDEMFRPLFATSGRPSVYPGYTFLCMLIQLEMGWSDREMEQASRFDDRVKYALGVDRGFEGVDAVTLCGHRKLFLENDYANVMMQKSLEDAMEEGLFSPGGRQIVDSFLIEGAAARQDTYTLIRKAIVRTLKIASFHELEKELVDVLERDDYFQEGKPRIDWEDDGEKRLLLESLVHDALRVVEKGRSLLDGDKEDLKDALDLLERVATQDVDIDDEGRVQMAQRTAKDRVISTVDPEMRHGRKTTSSKTDGYKVVISCGGEGDRFVTGVEVDGANASEVEMMPQVLEAQQEQGVKPDRVLADSGFSNVEKNEEIKHKYGVEIEAKLHPASNRGGCYSKDEFAIDLEEGTVTCPAGEQACFDPAKPEKHRPTGASFSAEACNSCGQKDRCTNSDNGRTINIHPYERERQEIKDRQQTEEFKQEYRERSAVERVGAHMKRHGLEKGRYLGRVKTKFQAQMAAVLQNIKSLIRLAAPAQGEVCPA